MTIPKEVEVVREMVKQGVSSLFLKGPLGAEIRQERRPIIKDLTRRGFVSENTLRAMDEVDT
jgi:hypothetical protein